MPKQTTDCWQIISYKNLKQLLLRLQQDNFLCSVKFA